jgi:hypothetical protein
MDAHYPVEILNQTAQASQRPTPVWGWKKARKGENVRVAFHCQSPLSVQVKN